MIPNGFKGRARRLDDVDLPRLGALIGVGEDEIHAVLDVESRGTGFDRQRRPLILFEPHIFYRLLRDEQRALAIRRGLAYRVWGHRPYPPDSYPRLQLATEINETAALKACSWGLGQILGVNHKAAGFATVQAMVAAMCDDEEAHLLAMVNFIKANGLDRHLRTHNWAAFARGYNGSAYAKNHYDTRLARAFDRWRGIKNTPWNPQDAACETIAADLFLRATTVQPASPPVPAAPATHHPEPSLWRRFINALARRTP